MNKETKKILDASPFGVDLINFETFTQLQLNKKIIKWKNQLEKLKCMDDWLKRKHQIKYFNMTFEPNRIYNPKQWSLYLHYIQLNLILIECVYNYKKKCIDKLNALKLSIYKKNKNKCEFCGGEYTNSNRLAHITTKKHQTSI
jgi:hypothetical protein